MSRPIWTGTVSFGLLQIPVQLYSGESSVDVHFRMLDSRDEQPIRYERVNAETGEEVPWKEVVKAFEYAKGSYVVVDEEDIRAAAPEQTETVELEAFVKQADVDPRYFQRPYILVPGKKAQKGYVLLREILKRSGRIGIARVVIRTRQYLAALIPLDDALILNLMRFPQELVQVEEFNLPAGNVAKFKIAARELEMGQQLIESMSTSWAPADYADDFRAKLRKMIEAQVVARKRGKKGRKPAAAPRANAEAGTSNVVDFTALLRKSLESKGDIQKPGVKRKKAS